jgi:hypothetical protein
MTLDVRISGIYCEIEFGAVFRLVAPLPAEIGRQR